MQAGHFRRDLRARVKGEPRHVSFSGKTKRSRRKAHGCHNDQISARPRWLALSVLPNGYEILDESPHEPRSSAGIETAA